MHHQNFVQDQILLSLLLQIHLPNRHTKARCGHEKHGYSEHERHVLPGFLALAPVWEAIVVQICIMLDASCHLDWSNRCTLRGRNLHIRAETKVWRVEPHSRAVFVKSWKSGLAVVSLADPNPVSSSRSSLNPVSVSSLAGHSLCDIPKIGRQLSSRRSPQRS